MPEIYVELAEGRTAEQKKAIMKGITDVIVQTLGADPETVVVTIHEIKLENKMKGGRTFVERRKPQPPEQK